MKVITVKQPFATLIKEGLKEYEFRTWKINYRGDIYIHAGKSIDKEAMKRYEHLHLSYPTGCILAKAKIVDCIVIDDEMKKILKEKDPLIYFGALQNKEKIEYGWKLENIESIEEIPIRGKLGLWEYPEIEK